MLTGNGATTGALMTEGFRDTLRLRDGTREDAVRQPPRAAASRSCRASCAYGVARADRARGREVRRARRPTTCAPRPRRFARARASRRSRSRSCTRRQNAAHERRAREIVAELMPDAYVTASSDLLPQVRYYDRTSTTVLNAYVGPIISALPERADARASRSSRFGGVLLIMQSNGGVATPAEVVASARRCRCSRARPPGPTAGLWQLAAAGLDDCITVDMGGTSFDVALVRGGEPLLMIDGVVDRWRLALPTIDIHTIGAGGGSIAWLDEGGLLHVGPQSAGAEPGPACYGRGGTQPTVTDADLVLGYLGDGVPRAAGCGSTARPPCARSSRSPTALGLDRRARPRPASTTSSTSTMATGVRDVTRAPRARPARLPARGRRRRRAAARGGDRARARRRRAARVPRESSIFCAAGMLMSDFKHDYVRALQDPARRRRPGAAAAPCSRR